MSGRRTGAYALAVLGGIVPVLAVLWQSSGWGLTGLFTPPMEDLMVYRRAAEAWLAGRDPYRLENSYPFIYPPFAVLPSLLFAVVPPAAAKVLWVVGNVAAMYALLARLGVRGTRALALVTALMLALGPMSNTAQLGQLGIWLMVMCTVDVLDSSPAPTPGRRARRWLPVGVWVGLATGLKLTPGVFIVLFLLLRRWREAFVASVTFAVTIVVGTLAMPEFGMGYWSRLAHGDSGANPDAFGWIHNQSLLSGWQRFNGVDQNRGGLLLCALLVVLALTAAYRCMRRDQPWLAAGLLGLASSLANPIAWLHHLTWILPLAIGAWRATVPHAVRLVTLIAALWWQVKPYQNLPGAPWAEAEIHRYTVAEKLLGWGGALLCLLAVAVTAAWPWRTPVAERQRITLSERANDPTVSERAQRDEEQEPR